jgi:hypothetical protein
VTINRHQNRDLSSESMMAPAANPARRSPDDPAVSSAIPQEHDKTLHLNSADES